MTCWRAQVMYVLQSRVNFKGTPQEFLNMVQGFCSQVNDGRLSALNWGSNSAGFNT